VESIVADWLASEFCLLSTRTDEIDLRRLDASAAVACQIDLCQLSAGWLADLIRISRDLWIRDHLLEAIRCFSLGVSGP
jgi:hypothetical protein